ncbi:MAG TPA: hypothetical protein PKW35_07280 [Nannocystaceae bacterium]|nr:hypothetical protein [Nannocystaceae bacterium]
MQTIFRVDEVLRGDSPTVALIGRDVGDRQVRLEVPAAMVGGVRVGSALVIEWWTAEMPAAAADPVASGPSSPWPRGYGSTTTTAAASGATGATGSATPTTTTSASGEEAAPAPLDEAQLEQEFRALIGLR